MKKFSKFQWKTVAAGAMAAAMCMTGCGDAAQAVKDNNTDTMVASVTATDGGIYGVPFTGNTWFMYYDKSVFSEDDVKNLIQCSQRVRFHSLSQIHGM